MADEPHLRAPRAADAAPTHRRHRDEEGPPPRARWILPVGLAFAAAGIAAIVLNSMKDKAIYSKPVDELLAQKATFVGRPVRAEGTLVHGTLVKRDSPCEYRFTIQKGNAELPVRFAQCVVPDTFQDLPDMPVGVTVQGTLQSDDTFEASEVLAKCPSKYEMNQRKGRGEAMPHGPLAGGDMGGGVSERPIVGATMEQR